MKMNDIRCALKLWGGSLGLMVVLVVIMLGVGIYRGKLTEAAVGRLAVINQQLTDVVRWRGLIETNVQRLLAANMSTDPHLVDLMRSKFQQGMKDIDEVQQRIGSRASADTERRQLEQIASARATVAAASKELAQVAQAGAGAGVVEFVSKTYLPTVDIYLAELAKFEAVQAQIRDAEVAASEQQRARALLIGLVVVVLAMIAGALFIRLLVRSINIPLQRAVTLAQSIEAGDLRHRIDSSRADEFGQLERSLSAMSAQLHGLVSAVREGIDSVSQASSEIAQGNQDLSSRTEQAASNLQQTASGMEELNSTVAQTSEQANQATRLATSAADLAGRGGQVVGDVVRTMDTISQSSRKIADIIGVIDGIAFQTNILALNAAVEAARAGEQGRGFAVVAGEVRNLAQRSAEAAREIKSLITDSVEKVENGSRQVQVAGSTMQDIVASVARVSTLIGEIAAATGEQRVGLSQITTAVGQLDSLTQQNAALVEESAAAASSLNAQAGGLAALVTKFKL